MRALKLVAAGAALVASGLFGVAVVVSIIVGPPSPSEPMTPAITHQNHGCVYYTACSPPSWWEGDEIPLSPN